MSNYCACSGGDEEYTIELNQQGPEGPQGEVGPEGFSPSISVKTNTDRSYILTVVNKEETFDTPNLYGELEKLNADLSNIPNPAYINGVSLSSIEDNIPMITMDSSRITTNIDGNLILNATASNEETMEVSNYEVVVNPKEQRLELHDNEGTVKVVAVTDEIAIVQSQLSSKLDKATYEADKATYATKEELASTDATVASIQTELGNKLESSNIIAGANISIDRSGNNLTISSTGGGGGGSSIDDSSISSASTWSSSKINSVANEIRDTKNDNIFDISKFTVAGSPTITDYGVASGFSAGSYLTKTLNNNITIDKVNMYGTFVLNANADTQNAQEILVALSDVPGDLTSTVIQFAWVKATGRIGLAYHNNTAWVGTYGNVSPTPGNKYWYHIYYANESINLDLSTDGVNYTNHINSNITISDTISSSLVQIGSIRNGANYFTGQIDLKYFSITVDEVNVFNGLMESTKPIYDRLSSTSTELSTFKTDTDNNFSAVNSALNEKANLSDLAGYVPLTKYNELLARVVALETEINGGNA